MFHRTIYGSLSVLVVVALGASAVQCSSSGRDGYEASPDAAAPPEQQFVSPVDAAAEANAPNDIDQECTGENAQIYVVARDPDTIYRFDPASLTFALLGKLDCPYKSAFSMAVDRRGYAWVLFGSSFSFTKVRLSDLECKEVSLNNRPESLYAAGMGFAKDDSIAGESLFLYSKWGHMFRVDPPTRDVSMVGMPGQGMRELAGTGEGKLFGYTPWDGQIAQFDKTTGAILETYRTSAAVGGSYAFAQWGGDFWIFLGKLDTETSRVYRYSPTTDETTIAVEDSGLDIVGAGSSTCAPFAPVK